MCSRPQRGPLCLGPLEKKELRNQGPVPCYALVSLVSLEALVSRGLVSLDALASWGLVSLGFLGSRELVSLGFLVSRGSGVLGRQG